MFIHLSLRISQISVILFLLFSFILILPSCTTDYPDELEATHSKSIDDQLDYYSIATVWQMLEERGPVRNWEEYTDDKLIFSIGVHTDSTYSVGVQPPGTEDLKGRMHTTNFDSPVWEEYRNVVKAIVLKNPNNKFLHVQPIRISIAVKIEDFETFKLLRSSPFVRWIHPTNSFFFNKNNKGKGLSFAKGPSTGGTPSIPSDPIASSTCSCEISVTVNPADYTDVTQPYVNKLPWNYNLHDVSNRSWIESEGQNIGVAVIDTGVSDDQENLGSSFNTPPFSTSRVIQKVNTLRYRLDGNGRIIIPVDSQSADDDCGHGTRMAGIIGAPKGFDGAAVGVAPQCDLYIYRAVFNPVIDQQEEFEAVAEALELASQNAAVKIISMSIGQIPGEPDSPLLEIALDLADDNDKLVYCAAGTLPGLAQNFDVVFPASYAFTRAVTGIRTPFSYPNALDQNDPECSSCFTGPEVDHAVIMQRPQGFVDADQRTTLTLSCEGDEPNYSDGTSCATATQAGMAALVWADQGVNVPRTNVESIIISSSSNATQVSQKFGFGWLDLEVAIP